MIEGLGTAGLLGILGYIAKEVAKGARVLARMEGKTDALLLLLTQRARRRTRHT